MAGFLFSIEDFRGKAARPVLVLLRLWIECVTTLVSRGNKLDRGPNSKKRLLSSNREER